MERSCVLNLLYFPNNRDSWKKLADMPQQQAVELYIQELFETDPEWEAKYAVTDDLVRYVYVKMNRNAGTEQSS